MKIFFVYSDHYGHVLREQGCRILITFATVKRKIDIARYYGFIPTLPEGYPEIMIDSGGYQLKTGVRTSMRITTEEYSNWLRDAMVKYPEIVAFMNLDDPTDPALTFKNQFDIEKRLKEHNCRIKAPLPVWHRGEPWEYLDYYCSNYEWISVGGLVGTGTTNKKNVINLVNMLHQKFPKNKFHMLGLGILGVLGYQQSNPYSCDFSTWSTVSRFGNEIISYGRNQDKFHAYRDGEQVIKEVSLPRKDKHRLYAKVSVPDEVYNSYNSDNKDFNRDGSIEPRYKSIKNPDYDETFHEYLTSEAVKNLQWFEDYINSNWVGRQALML